MAAKGEVHYDSNLLSPQDIANSITQLGFPASVMDNDSPDKGHIELKVSFL